MKEQDKKFTREALIKAYFDCRKHKRQTIQAKYFEFELEKNISELYFDILYKRYKIGRSICFIVTEPKLREVWAGAFRDRIVHHLIYNAIEERFTKTFIKDTYSCLPERGTLLGGITASKYAQRVTRNWSQEAYFLKADISNFFNRIDKNILFELIKKKVKEPWLIELIEQVIFHNPKTNAFMKSNKKLYELIPQRKRLFCAQENKGLPIGNLTSQFFSNIYLNELDQFVKHKLKCRYYCRYVDDVILMNKSSNYLNFAYSEMNSFLEEKLKLSFNHKKKLINHVVKGVDFVGYVIKPHRMLIRKRTVNKSLTTLNKWKKLKNKYSTQCLEDISKKINSYLGMSRRIDGYSYRKFLCEQSCDNIFLGYDKDYTKIIVK